MSEIEITPKLICPICELANVLPEKTVCIQCKCHLYHKPFIAAFKKGLSAPGDRNPYPDQMGGRHDHVVTWSRSFRKYWYWQRGKDWQQVRMALFKTVPLRKEQQ